MSYSEWKDKTVLDVARSHGVDMQRVPVEALEKAIDEGHDRGWHEGVKEGGTGFANYASSGIGSFYIPKEIVEQALREWKARGSK